MIHKDHRNVVVENIKCRSGKRKNEKYDFYEDNLNG